MVRTQLPEVSSRVRSLLKIAVLPVCALLLLLWAATTLVPADGLGGDTRATAVAALAATAPVITLLAIVLITLALRRRRFETVVITALAALLPWVTQAAGLLGDQPNIAEATDLRVMVINAGDGRASAQDIVAAVTGNAIQVLVVTELTNELAHDLTTAGLNKSVTAAWVALPGQPGVATEDGAGMGVWTSVPVESTDDVPGTSWPARRLTLADPKVTLVAGHVVNPLPFNGSRWANDLRALRNAGRSAGRPTVVLGNLNATSWHADLRAFHSAGLPDAVAVLGGGPLPTWPSWSPVALLQLDHVMVSRDIAVPSTGTVAIDGSDHRGLLASLRIPLTPG